MAAEFTLLGAFGGDSSGFAALNLLVRRIVEAFFFFRFVRRFSWLADVTRKSFLRIRALLVAATQINRRQVFVAIRDSGFNGRLSISFAVSSAVHSFNWVAWHRRLRML